MACPQTPLVGTHTYACVSVLLHATIILLASCYYPVPPPQLKILYETLPAVRLLVVDVAFCAKKKKEYAVVWLGMLSTTYFNEWLF